MRKKGFGSREKGERGSEEAEKVARDMRRGSRWKNKDGRRSDEEQDGRTP